MRIQLTKRRKALFLGVLLVVAAALVAAGLVFLHGTPKKAAKSPAKAPLTKAQITAGFKKLGGSSQQVTIFNGTFTPSAVTVSKNISVKWDNLEALPHQIIFDNPPSPVKNSPILKQGQTYSLSFPAAGAYGYHDAGNTNAKGTITVTQQ